MAGPARQTCLSMIDRATTLQEWSRQSSSVYSKPIYIAKSDNLECRLQITMSYWLFVNTLWLVKGMTSLCLVKQQFCKSFLTGQNWLTYIKEDIKYHYDCCAWHCSSEASYVILMWSCSRMYSILQKDLRQTSDGLESLVSCSGVTWAENVGFCSPLN